MTHPATFLTTPRVKLPLRSPLYLCLSHNSESQASGAMLRSPLASTRYVL
jgi:hypothetical protein